VQKFIHVLRRIRTTYVIFSETFRAAGMFEESGGAPPHSKALRAKKSSCILATASLRPAFKDGERGLDLVCAELRVRFVCD
jgi:hypothetical protein